MYRQTISLRYIRKRTTALLAILAVTFGVATLLTALSIMEGYVVELQRMIRDQDSDLTVSSTSPLNLCSVEEIQKEIEALDHVVGTAPYIQTLAMYQSGRFNPCSLRSLDPEGDLRITRIGSYLLRPHELDDILSHQGSVADLDEFRKIAEEKAKRILDDASREDLTEEEVVNLFSRKWRRTLFRSANPAIAGQFDRHNPSAIIVGLNFLTSRNLDPGQLVRIVTRKAVQSKTLSGSFMVAGAFKTGDFKMDSSVFLVHLNRMKTFLEAYRPNPAAGQFDECVDGIRIALDDHEQVETVRIAVERVRRMLPFHTQAHNAVVKTWQDSKRIFLQAVEIEKWIIGFVVSLLNIFTGCLILLMLVLIVLEKTRDSGVLLALGATPNGVMSIFLSNGVIITGIGTVLGLVVGICFVTGINWLHDAVRGLTGITIFDPEVYFMDRIPVVITLQDVVLSALPAVIFGIVSSLVPAAWASRKNPIEAIHHE